VQRLSNVGDVDVITDRSVIEASVSAAWQIDGDAIVRVVQTLDFATGLAYVNSVGAVAEELNHHPDIDLRYDTVTIRLSTHYLGGITENDFQLAGRIDKLDDVEAG
jgi:4a-hydroxytetrahydrobiopterin dehydratase